MDAASSEIKCLHGSHWHDSNTTVTLIFNRHSLPHLPLNSFFKRHHRRQIHWNGSGQRLSWWIYSLEIKHWEPQGGAVKKINDTSLFINFLFSSWRTCLFKYSQTQDTGARDAVIDKSLTEGVVVLLCEHFLFGSWGRDNLQTGNYSVR